MSPSDDHILFVSHKYPPSTGGMEKQSFELINQSALYIRVHTIIYDQRESILKFFLDLNKRILEKIKQHPEIKLIHFNDGLIGALSTFHRGYEHIKTVVTLHGLDLVFPLAVFQKKILPRFNKFDLIIAVSQATALAAKQRGLDEQKVRVVLNGVHALQPHKMENDISSIYSKYAFLEDRSPYFIVLGRAVKRKGFSWLMKNVIPELQGNFKLIMVGPFDFKPKWKEKLIGFLPKKLRHLVTLFLGFPSDQADIRKELERLRDKVIHLGKVPYQDLEVLLSSATAFVMPNITVAGDMEGFGLVCLEASLAGTLVVASSIEGISSAIGENNGIPLASMDRQAWISQLQCIINNPEEYTSKALQYQKYTAENYSWDKMAREYVDIFLGVLQQKNG